MVAIELVKACPGAANNDDEAGGQGEIVTNRSSGMASPSAVVGPRLAGFRLEVPLVADACKVRASTPNVEFWLAALLGWRDPRPVKKAPPVACGAQNYAKETCLHTRAFRLRIRGAGTTPRVQPHG